MESNGSLKAALICLALSIGCFLQTVKAEQDTITGKNVVISGGLNRSGLSGTTFTEEFHSKRTGFQFELAGEWPLKRGV